MTDRLIVTTDEGTTNMSIPEFLRDNPELAACVMALPLGETYHGGGGAQPEWSITRTTVVREASRRARETIDARGVACTCGAWTTVAPAYHERWCLREVEEAREFARIVGGAQ
jgi:TusA-related sulfurtransferase